MAAENPHASYRAIILIGGSLSEPVDLGGRRLMGVVFPDTMDSTSMGFQVKVDGAAEYSPMYDEAGDEVLLDVQTSKCVVVDPVKFLAVNKFKFHCGTDGADQTETAERTLILLTAA